MKDPKLYLIHIQECIDRIFRYIAGGPDPFFSDTLIQDATVRNLQVMAESTQRLPEELKAKHPEIKWTQISGFRNVLVHDYLDVDIRSILPSL